jgi:hypothetical protein
MVKTKLPKGMRKRIRQEKADLRRAGFSGEEYREKLHDRLKDIHVLTVGAKTAKTNPPA